MVHTMERQGFNRKFCRFMYSYLSGRQTTFFFQRSKYGPVEVTQGVGQGSCLSPILSGLYIAPVLHECMPVDRPDTIFYSMTKFFVDDAMLINSSDDLQENCDILQRRYQILAQKMFCRGVLFGADKTELIHFRKDKRTQWSNQRPLGPDVHLWQPGKGDEFMILPPYEVKAKEKVRYLGFFLDNKLRFRDHINFYANKGMRTLNVIQSLGNSIRGVTPIDKRRLYIANVLTLMTYGIQLWWQPNWKGMKWALNMFQTVQNKAARWITGAFKTSPTGAIEILAGLVPIRHQLKQYVHRNGLRIHTLGHNHPLRMNLPQDNWERNDLNVQPTMPMTTERQTADTPIKWLHQMRTMTDERFDLLHDEVRPGNRLIDLYADRIDLSDLVKEKPKKPKPLREGQTESPEDQEKREKFQQWVDNEFKPELADVLSDWTNLVIFTDGSHQQQPDDHKHVSGAAWAVYRVWDIVAEGRRSQGNSTSFDAEMMALYRGIMAGLATTASSRDRRGIYGAGGSSVKHIYVYTDNKSAGLSILNPNMHPSQWMSIGLLEWFRKYFVDFPENRLTIRWCPSHVGVEQNDYVDHEAKEAMAEEQPAFTSYSVARANTVVEKLDNWRKEIKDPTILHTANFIYPDAYKDKVTHLAKQHMPLKLFGRSHRMLARFTRVLVGHCPIGSFRLRFKLSGITRCPCGEEDWTRQHVLFDCPFFYRKDFFQQRDDVMRLDPFKEIAKFLTKNPYAFTFEFSDLYDQLIRAEQRRGHIPEIIYRENLLPNISLSNDELFHILTARDWGPDEIDDVIEAHTRPPGDDARFNTRLTIARVNKLDPARINFFEKLFEPRWKEHLIEQIAYRKERLYLDKVKGPYNRRDPIDVRPPPDREIGWGAWLDPPNIEGNLIWHVRMWCRLSKKAPEEFWEREYMTIPRPDNEPAANTAD